MTVDNDDPRGLKARLRRVGKTQTDLADYLGVDLNVIYRITAGQRKRLSAEEAQNIEAFFAAIGAAEARGAESSDLRAAGSGATVPLYGFAAAAPVGPIHLDHGAAAERVARHPNQGRSAEGFAVRVWGESMSPRYEPGEIAYCVRGQHPRRGQDVIIETRAGDAWLKTYERQADGRVWVTQLNPPPGQDERASFDLREIAAMHAVVGRG